MAITGNWFETTLSDITQKADIEIDESQLQVRSIVDLRKKLAEIISHLIDTNFEKLLWILYRVDVDEEKAKQILAANFPSEVPDILAELIIQRQLKKDELKQQFQTTVKASEEDAELLL